MIKKPSALSAIKQNNKEVVKKIAEIDPQKAAMARTYLRNAPRPTYGTAASGLRALAKGGAVKKSTKGKK